MSVERLKKQLADAKSRAASLAAKQTELIKRLDDTRQTLPLLQRRIIDTQIERQKVFDSFVLGECDKKSLDKADKDLVQAENDLKTGQETCDALKRGLDRCVLEIPKAQTECDLAKRQVWQSVFDEIKAEIPATVFDSIRKLQIAGIQCSQTRQWVLNSLFTNPSSEENLEIQKQIAEQYQIE